jgi:hypothetical protein
MVEKAIPFNRRKVQFARRRQHLVNHGLQRGVNHSRQTPHRYVRLTQNIKRIPTRFCHDCCVTRQKSRARESFEASMRSGGCAGSGRALRLDPSGLPVRFFAGDAAADGQVRDVELHRERVVMRRALRGMRMALNMPVAAFDGVSLWLMPGEAGDDDALAVVLKHRDPTLTLPLFVTSRTDEALAEWRAWSQVLDVPLLLAEQRGSSTIARAQIDGLHIERPRPRRRRRSALKARRPSIPLRRATGKITNATPIHRDEREIIARN